MFSIICVYNDKQLMDENLAKSLHNQTLNHEFIAIDNTTGRFKSAASALNYGLDLIKDNPQYVIFAHQDILLTSKNFLEDLKETLLPLTNLGIAGVAGRADLGKVVISNIMHGTPPIPAGKVQISTPTEVQTLDECFVVIPKLILEKNKLDENTCPDWHLYIVDFCLSLKTLGYNIVLLPLTLYHRSTGTQLRNILKVAKDLGDLPKGYYSTIGDLLKKHKNDYKAIYATTGVWYTASNVPLQRFLKLLRIMAMRFLKTFKIKISI